MTETPTRWREKPVTVDAFRYRLDHYPQWFIDAVNAGKIEIHATSCTICTPEGLMRADSGTWIIRGVKGELYPCRPDIFARTYEPADG